MSKITVKQISNPEQLKEAFTIRRKVFVEEQQVPANEEYDEWEESATHFIAYMNEVPCGTARWRFTNKGIKLERFAVLQEARGSGLGQALVAKVLESISNAPGASGKQLYLHAQLPAQSLYQRFGFKAEGEQFDECGIQHYLMKKANE